MSNNYFACKTDKAPHTYRCGETATLILSFRNEGKTVSASELVPNYLRLAQAEREKLQKEGKL